MTYTKFIIVCSVRTSSNLLVEKLRSHPNIVSYPEMFSMTNTREYRGQKFSSYTRKHLNLSESEAVLSREKDLEYFLANVLLRENYPNQIKAVGFKIMYEDLIKNKILKDFIDNHSIKIIHLYRANLLDSYISSRRAQITGCWINTSIKSNSKSKKVIFALDPEKCRDFFEETEYYNQLVRKLYFGKKLWNSHIWRTLLI